MSTKIYYAYRVKRQLNILGMLNQLTYTSFENLKYNGKFLELMHVDYFNYTLDQIKNSSKKSGKRKYYIELLNEIYEGEMLLSPNSRFADYLNSRQNSIEIQLVDVYLNASILFDNNYWYVKFFPNVKWQRDIVDIFEKFSGVEDYHYQNQTDPPENVDEREFNYRGEKWDELLKSGGGSWSNALNYDVVNTHKFCNFLTKYYYTGDELYSHLAYKFDRCWPVDKPWAKYIKSLQPKTGGEQ